MAEIINVELKHSQIQLKCDCGHIDNIDGLREGGEITCEKCSSTYQLESDNIS